MAQDRPESILPPGFGEPATPAPEPVTNDAARRRPTPVRERQSVEGSAVEIVESLLGDEMAEAEPVPQVEYPRFARRDPRVAGTLDPVDARLWHAGRGARRAASSLRNPDAADGHAAGVALGAHRLAQRAACQGAEPRATSIPPTGPPSGPGCCFGWARPMPRGC